MANLLTDVLSNQEQLVEFRSISAFEATAADIQESDGIIFGTPANFGYMSGALKDAREIIVENGIVPIRMEKKKANNNLKLNTSPKEITGLLYSDAFQQSLNNVNKYLSESNI